MLTEAKSQTHTVRMCLYFPVKAKQELNREAVLYYYSKMAGDFRKIINTSFNYIAEIMFIIFLSAINFNAVSLSEALSSSNCLRISSDFTITAGLEEVKSERTF